MLHISDELKSAFLSDTVKKNIEIEFEPTEEIIPDDFSRVNFYDKYDVNASMVIVTSSTTGYANGRTAIGGNFADIFPAYNTEGRIALAKYEKTTKYVYTSFNVWISSLTGITTPAKVEFYLAPRNENNSISYVKIAERTYAELSSDYTNVSGCVELDNTPTHVEDRCFLDNSSIYVRFLKSDGEYSSSDTFTATIYVDNRTHIQIGNDRDAFPYSNDIQVVYNNLDFDDYVTYTEKPDKFSRINFWNESIPHDIIRTNVRLSGGFGPDIDDWAINDYLQESGMYQLKFKCKITSFSAASGVDTPIKYAILLYRKRSNGTTASYSSSVFDFQLNVDETVTFNEYTGDMANSNIVGLSGVYLFLYKSNGQGWIERYSPSEIGSFTCELSDVSLNLGYFRNDMPYPNEVQVEYIGGNIEDYLVYPPHTDGFTLDNSDLIRESFALSESISGSDKLRFGATEAAICEFESPTIVNKDLFGLYFRPYISCEGFEERIPLGRFRVKNVTRRGSHNLVTKRIQAYDGIYPLSRSGSSWYTNYMGLVYNFNKTFTGVSQRVWTAPRQMFATLYNVLDNIDIELPIENISIGTVTLYNTTQADGGKIILKERTGSDYYNSDYVDCSIAYGISVSPAKKYRVRIGYDYKTVLNEYFEEVGYRSRFGLYPSRGGVIIAEQDSDGKINMFSVNDGDWFAVSPNATYIQILIPSKYTFGLVMRKI